MSQKSKQKIWLSLSAIGIMTLTGCNSEPSTPVAAMKFCPIPIHADDCTKEWLKQQHPPECVHDWVRNIADQQDAIEDKCK